MLKIPLRTPFLKMQCGLTYWWTILLPTTPPILLMLHPTLQPYPQPSQWCSRPKINSWSPQCSSSLSLTALMQTILNAFTPQQVTTLYAHVKTDHTGSQDPLTESVSNTCTNILYFAIDSLQNIAQNTYQTSDILKTSSHHTEKVPSYANSS